MKVSAMATVEFTALSNAAKKVYECSCEGDTPRMFLMTANILIKRHASSPH
jgi:hypothetical protein